LQSLGPSKDTQYNICAYQQFTAGNCLNFVKLSAADVGIEKKMAAVFLEITLVRPWVVEDV